MKKLLYLLTSLSVLVSINTYAQAKQKLELKHFDTIPESWRSEVMALPPKFAPSFEHQGRLELLFLPGMFKPEQSDFFSYSFLWMIDGKFIPNRHKNHVIRAS